MIAASGILVVIAFVTLIAGVFRTGLGLIWTSIAASILAGIFLLLGVVQGNNKRRVATQAVGPAGAAPAWSDQPAQAPAIYSSETAAASMEETAVMERPSLAAVPAPEEDEEMAPSGAVVAEMKPEPAAPTRPSRTRAASSTAAEVVVIPDRDKFHKETCRYAKNPAAMTMSKAAAKRQGYKACGVCKP